MSWTLFWQLVVLLILIGIIISNIVNSAIEKKSLTSSFAEYQRSRNWAAFKD